MKHRPWLKYIHWFGYFASVIVILQLLFLGYIGVAECKKREDRRDETRMHQEPATQRLHTIHGAEAYAALLSRLPPLETLAPDGFRLIAAPSFGDTDFAIALHRTSKGGEGVMFMAPTSAGDSSKAIQIKLSLSDYDRLVVDIDKLAAAWGGEAGWWTDGTGVVLERIRGKDVSSGVGNSPNFYGKVGALVFEAVRPTTPQLDRFDNSWHPKEVWADRP